jgi:molecular chaperone GrpE (heat shock protein)
MAAATELPTWLQEREPWPEGVVQATGETENPDLYTLLEGMTALRQEISLQGRSFHNLEQALGQLFEGRQPSEVMEEKILSLSNGFSVLQTMLESVSFQLLGETQKEGREEGRQQAFRSLIDPLLDTHDQLRRWVEQNRIRLEKGWRWRIWFSGRKLLKESLDVARLCEKKLSQRLDSLGVAPIARVGAEFNPETMKAVAMVESSEQQTDTVLEVYRQGYAVQGRVLRFAEVKVACPKKDVHEAETIV